MKEKASNPDIMRDEHLKTAERHIENNLTEAIEGRKCVDGRYPDNTGQIARAGGGMGYVEILLALNDEKQLGMTPVHVFNKVYDAVTRKDDFFYFHTDELSDSTNHSMHSPDRPIIGCGHCAKAANPDLADQYGLKAEGVVSVTNFAKERAAQGDSKMKLVMLTGSHAELGAIIVDSDSYSVNANNKKTGTQYFIYDKKRDDAFMDQLVEDLAIEGITREDFQKVSDMQTNATLRLLAPGKPIIHAAIDDEGNVITDFLGYIPLVA